MAVNNIKIKGTIEINKTKRKNDNTEETEGESRHKRDGKTLKG